MAKILCVGLNPAYDTTLIVDALALGAVNKATSQTHAAGKALNAAGLLAKLGHSVAMAGFLGKENADGFERAFAALGVANACVYTAGKTRQNIKIAEPNRVTDINGAGFCPSADDKRKLLQSVQAHDADFVLVLGSLPVGFGRADFAALLDAVQKDGARLVVDTSGEALKEACLRAPFLLKPNADEIAEAFFSKAGELTFEEERQWASAQAATHVVISRGSQGARWWQKSQILWASAPKVALKSSVGAGDTLLAGLVHGLATGDDREAILRQAVAMAAHSVSVVGVELADAERLANLAQSVDVRFDPTQSAHGQ